MNRINVGRIKMHHLVKWLIWFAKVRRVDESKKKQQKTEKCSECCEQERVREMKSKRMIQYI